MPYVTDRMKLDFAMGISTTSAVPYPSSGGLVTTPTPSFISERFIWRVTPACLVPIRRAAEIRLQLFTRRHMTHVVRHTTFVPT